MLILYFCLENEDAGSRTVSSMFLYNRNESEVCCVHHCCKTARRERISPLESHKETELILFLHQFNARVRKWSILSEMKT